VELIMESGEEAPGRSKKQKRIYYRKRVELLKLIDKVKLWPSRTGVLHGVKSIEIVGDRAIVTTHCEKQFAVSNSRNSRAARWLRNKWYRGSCEQCAIPQWKLDKYSATFFGEHGRS
jgi:pyrrolysyl-tRNA synthetase-like protein